MICEKYDALTTKEKIDYIGKITHAVMNSNNLFHIGTKLIEAAEAYGMFDNVTINPSINEPKTGI